MRSSLLFKYHVSRKYLRSLWNLFTLGSIINRGSSKEFLACVINIDWLNSQSNLLSVTLIISKIAPRNLEAQTVLLFVTMAM